MVSAIKAEKKKKVLFPNFFFKQKIKAQVNDFLHILRYISELVKIAFYLKTTKNLGLIEDPAQRLATDN